MCGICGIFSFKDTVNPLDVEKMNRTLKHRGPDDEGYLVADTKTGTFSPKIGSDTVPTLRDRFKSIGEPERFKANLLFGHRRLSIIDLSDKGHQPMIYDDNWIIYNGEIYNYLELRKELMEKGYAFRSNTDTEVIMAAYKEWGVDCFNRLNGMWALALWDQVKRRLLCARDRFGIKPFYFLITENYFVFASEIKAILAFGLSTVEPNDRAVFEFLTYGLVDHLNETFFKGIHRLMPGEYLLIDESGGCQSNRWWHLEHNDSPCDITSTFRDLFRESVKIRLRSDVPVGSCLSGGLDSSYVVSQMADLINPVNTFSAVYGPGQRGDESEYIDLVVEKTIARKHTIIPSADGLVEDIDKILYHQEEPFGSTSIFAQWKVMELAKERNVTVLLDGQGADEQLGGYYQYFGIHFANLFKRLRWGRLTRAILDYIKLHQNSKVFKYAVYFALPQRIQIKTRKLEIPLASAFRKKHSDHLPPVLCRDTNEVFCQYMEFNLPQLLRFEDKNSMAFSRETRLPFLDYRLAELIYSLPFEKKIDGAITKKVLRDAMDGMVPERIKQRYDKMGFETPEASWFRNELESFITSILFSDAFKRRKYWEPKAVQKLYNKFLHGDGESNILWRIICTELWIRSFID